MDLIVKRIIHPTTWETTAATRAALRLSHEECKQNNGGRSRGIELGGKSALSRGGTGRLDSPLALGVSMYDVHKMLGFLTPFLSAQSVLFVPTKWVHCLTHPPSSLMRGHHIWKPPLAFCGEEPMCLCSGSEIHGNCDSRLQNVGCNLALFRLELCREQSTPCARIWRIAAPFLLLSFSPSRGGEETRERREGGTEEEEEEH